MGDVVDLHTQTSLDIPAEKVIAAATAQELAEVVIVGWHADGSLFLAASSGSGGTSLWLLERAKQRLMEEPDGSAHRHGN